MIKHVLHSAKKITFLALAITGISLFGMNTDVEPAANHQIIQDFLKKITSNKPFLAQEDLNTFSTEKLIQLKSAIENDTDTQRVIANLKSQDNLHAEKTRERITQINFCLNRNTFWYKDFFNAIPFVASLCTGISSFAFCRKFYIEEKLPWHYHFFIPLIGISVIASNHCIKKNQKKLQAQKKFIDALENAINTPNKKRKLSQF